MPKYPAPFERLRYDEDYGHFAKTLRHRGRTVEVRFIADDDDSLSRLFPTAIEFWKARVRWFKAFREYAAMELLSNLNDSLDCGQEDFTPVTADQVRKRLSTPFSVEFTADYDETDDIYFEMAGCESDESV